MISLSVPMLVIVSIASITKIASFCVIKDLLIINMVPKLLITCLAYGSTAACSHGDRMPTPLIWSKKSSSRIVVRISRITEVLRDRDKNVRSAIFN